MAILKSSNTSIPTPIESSAPVEQVKIESYKAPEFIFPTKDPAKQESLDALIQAISVFKDVPETEIEDETLTDNQIKKFAKILKLLNYEQ
jgi:hypothetical protein